MTYTQYFINEMNYLTEYNSKEMNNHETNHKTETYGEPPNHYNGDHMKKNCIEKPSSAENGEEIVVFNIGGEIFETFRETIRKDNISVLSDDNFLRRYYRAKAGVYFFDRDPDVFRVCKVNKSTLVISKSKRPSETLRAIRTSTYQICRFEENTHRTTKFYK